MDDSLRLSKAVKVGEEMGRTNDLVYEDIYYF